MISPVKLRQQGGDGGGVGTRVAGLDRMALGVVGVGLDAPLHGEAIGLFAVLDEGHGLGRLAEGDRQHARGERIQSAGVAGLLGVEQALQPGDGLGRGQADGLVEHDPAVDFDAGGARRVHGASSSFASRLIVFRIVLRGLGEILRHLGGLQQGVDLGGVGEGLVHPEADFRRIFQIDLVGDLGAQIFLVAVEMATIGPAPCRRAA